MANSLCLCGFPNHRVIDRNIPLTGNHNDTRCFLFVSCSLLALLFALLAPGIPTFLLHILRAMISRLHGTVSQGALTMEWITPQHEEIDLNCEVSSYANAEL